MYLENDRIILRSMQVSDIDDIVYWNTKECEWMLWDAPWEYEHEDAAYDWDVYRKRKEEEIKHPQDMSKLQMRLEVCIKNEQQTHIGMVACYFIDEGYHINEQGSRLAIGMNIYSKKYRSSGYGTSAYALYMNYVKKFGYQTIYTQTWSGNIPLLTMAKKLGFQECNRYVDLRLVRGKRYDGITLYKQLDD